MITCHGRVGCGNTGEYDWLAISVDDKDAERGFGRPPGCSESVNAAGRYRYVFMYVCYTYRPFGYRVMIDGFGMLYWMCDTS